MFTSRNLKRSESLLNIMEVFIKGIRQWTQLLMYANSVFLAKLAVVKLLYVIRVCFI